MTPVRLPDVLVLGAGGVLGEAWMSGVLAGLEDAAGIDFRRCDTYVGTSAGSIVAARLASGRSPRRPDAVGDPPSDFARDTPVGLATDDADAGLAREPGGDDDGDARRGSRVVGAARGAARLGMWASAPLVGPALAATTPAGARLRALALARVPSGTNRLTGLHAQVSSWGARFDGRLRIAAVDRSTGRRVMFGRPGSPAASVADAVLASCAIPWVFRPVRIGDREYVDGGAWSFSNLDAAPAGRDTEVLCLNPATVSLEVARRSALAAARAAFAASAEIEAVALRARAAQVRVLGPDVAAADAMGTNFMATAPAPAVHAAGYAQGRRLATTAA